MILFYNLFFLIFNTICIKFFSRENVEKMTCSLNLLDKNIENLEIKKQKIYENIDDAVKM